MDEAGFFEGCNFTPSTDVSTEDGERPIGDLHGGEKVWAYNPQTQKMELQPIVHVWIHHDDDLVDLTITTKTKDGKQESEVIHTNQKHPFLTTEKGFVKVADLHVVRADGRVGVITTWQVVPGSMVMYDLEVAQDHTFTVGDGQWVVHNDCGKWTTLYRAISPEELKDVLSYGDYGLNSHGGGKYFAFTEDGMRSFARTSFNDGQTMTFTKVKIPVDVLDWGTVFYDTGGAGNAIHFDDEVMIKIYEVMHEIKILWS